MTRSTSPQALIYWIALLCAVAVAQPLEPRPFGEEPDIKIEATVKDRSNGITTLESKSTNRGREAVYVVTDIVRSDKSKGPYIEADSADPSAVICAFQFYEPSPFFPFVEHAGAHLRRLEPGESHKELIKLSFPLTSTEPPFVKDRVVFSARSAKRVQVTVAVFPASAPLIDLTRLKPAPHDVYTGMEIIKVEPTKKPLYLLQKLVHSNVVEVNFQD